ncbi:hypothetical protein BDR03DRAFT_1016917 [Suillus americanus]|nr:hypothetical protein BDR03DRAFT_1016917 [Suillus americanus]
MCWSTEAEPVPSVETLTASSLAEPPYGSQTFEMCWDVEPYPAPTVNALVNALVNAPVNASSAKQDLGGKEFNMCWETNTTPPKGQYDFCWDEPSSSQVVLVPAIVAMRMEWAASRG